MRHYKKIGRLAKHYRDSSKVRKAVELSSLAREANSTIVVDPILDPVDFLAAIRSAQAVTRFRFSVSRPNPHDVDRLIQRPAEEFTQLVEGDKAIVEVEGESLNKDVIEDVANSVAAVGEKAAADIRPEGGGRTKRIHLTGNPVVEPVEPAESQSVFAAVLQMTRSTYNRVRNVRQQ